MRLHILLRDFRRSFRRLRVENSDLNRTDVNGFINHYLMKDKVIILSLQMHLNAITQALEIRRLVAFRR